MTTTVEVPPRFRRLVSRHATGRNRSFKEHEEYDNDADTWGIDPEKRNVVGLMGEMAFAIHTQLKIDTKEVQWTDGGWDFEVTIDGIQRRVDVKTSQKEPYALMVKEDKLNADYYVLAHLEGESVRFLGVATKEMVLEGKYKESRFGHYNYEVPVRELDPLPDTADISG